MDWLWWILTVGLMLAGLIGTVLPLVPGTVLILCGAVVGFFGLHVIGWPTLLGLTLLTLCAQAVDIVSGAVGAKYFGATRWGTLGGIVGAVAGLFFMPLGIVIGPLAGVLIGELLGGKGMLPAGKSTWGTLLGTATGLVVKLAIGLVMVAWFAVDAAW